MADAFARCSAVPRETEGDRPAGPGAAGPNTEPRSSAAAPAAGEGPHSSPQPTGPEHESDSHTHTNSGSLHAHVLINVTFFCNWLTLVSLTYKIIDMDQSVDHGSINVGEVVFIQTKQFPSVCLIK